MGFFLIQALIAKGFTAALKTTTVTTITQTTFTYQNSF